jgi:hypothetical protein
MTHQRVAVFHWTSMDSLKYCYGKPCPTILHPHALTAVLGVVTPHVVLLPSWIPHFVWACHRVAVFVNIKEATFVSHPDVNG